MKADGQLWYLMIDKKRVGPITEEEVREKYEQREISPRTYAWTPGQGKWERLFNLPDLFSTDTLRGLGQRKDPKFKSTLPMPMLDGEEGQPPADPDDDELADIDPHAVTTQWDPDEVEAALEEERQAKEAPAEPELTEPEELKPKSPAATDGDEQPGDLDEDLDELFGRTGPKPQVREASTPDAAAEPPVREVSTPDAAAEPPVREVSTPDAAAEPPVREVSTPDAAAEPPVREVSTPDASAEPPVREVSTPDAAAEPPVRMVAVEDEAVDPLADTGPVPPCDDSGPDITGPAEEDEPEELENKLLGARDEDSVLFSRDQLDDLVQSLGYGPGDDESEQSLIDIKPLADDTLAISGTGEGDDIGPLPMAAPAANIMFPTEETEKRKSLVSILLMSFVGIILAFGLLAGVMYLVSPNLMHALLEGKLDQQLAGKASSVETGAERGKAAAPGAPVTPPAAGVKDEPPPAAGEPGDKVAQTPGQPRRPARKGPRRKRKGKRPAVAAVDPTRSKAPIRAKPPARTPAAKAAPVSVLLKTKPAKKGGDELDRLIDGALEGKPPKAAPVKKAPVVKKEPAAPRSTLTREVFNMAMSMAEDDVNACGKQFGKRGVVTIKITINGNTGRITGGRAVGSNAGTPVGGCVVKAARKSARFPKFGGSRTMSYAYILK